MNASLDHSSTQNLPQATTPAGFRACIDSLSSGVIRGWALELGRPEVPLGLVVRVDTTILGEGEASTFRPDLLAAGIGNGQHGFGFALDDLLPHAGKTLRLCTLNGVEIGTFDLPEAVQDPHVTLERIDVQGFALEACLVSNAHLGEHVLLALEGDRVVGQARFQVEPGLNRVCIELQAHLFDDRPHLLAVSFEGDANRLGAALVELRSVITPWQYVKHHVEQTRLVALLPEAGARYDSLARQLAALSTLPPASAPAAIANLQAVHARVTEGWKDRKAFPPFALPAVQQPKVSIVIPAHNKLELTYHAVASVALAYNEASYEVIVVDDCSTDLTSEIETFIENLVVVRNATNLGFLRSVNAAVLAARGQYIYLLNNDTEVRSRFLDEALAPFADPSIGMTGSKLINPDGSLQEAGGLVWGNGQPWNLGRDSSPMDPEWNYARDVDYISGAALCIPKKVWELVGGFSEEFAPAYYEDTDLAFKVRNAGLRTLYVPTSEVVHFEGQSNGRDVTKGIKRYQVVNDGTFRRKWGGAFRGNGKPGHELALHKDRNVDFRILALDYTTPNPQTDAGAYAAVREIEIFRSLGCKVTFVPENLAHLGALTQDLQRRGVEVLHAPFYRSVTDVLDKRLEEFDAVYITRFDVAERWLPAIRERSRCKVLLNNADLHFLRLLRADLAAGLMDLSSSVSVRDRELALMRQVDAILTYNEVEQAVIVSHNLKADNLFTCPWVLDPKPEPASFASREGIAFLGGYKHLPNVDAALYLAKDIMPALRAVAPGIKLYLYGSSMPPELEQLECDDIVPVGFVESLDDVYQKHRVFVAPLRSGAGIKGKVLDAMAYGMPSVLSTIAAESTGLQDEVSAMISDEPEYVARAIARVYRDEATWQRLSERSRELAQAKYSREKARQALAKVLGHVGFWPRMDRPTVGW